MDFQVIKFLYRQNCICTIITSRVYLVIYFHHHRYFVCFELYRLQFLSILIYLFIYSLATCFTTRFLLGPRGCRFDWISKDREPRETRGLVFQIETVETRTGLELAQFLPTRAASYWIEVYRSAFFIFTKRRIFKGYALSRIVSIDLPLDFFLFFHLQFRSVQ